MASLKEIMNVDEDSFDSDPLKKPTESAPRFSRAPDSVPSTSSYASPTESFASSSRKPSVPSPSTYPPRPLASETTSPSPSASNPDSRRRSNTSSDSMDPLYYGQGHAYAHGPMGTSATASRGYPSMASPEPPVKLTPITGRVSRAKKGVPVHICQDCTKTFTRAEHLRRHQLSHQPARYHCTVPGCDKSFHRTDLLERHQLRHEQEARMPPHASSAHSPGAGSGSTYMGQGFQGQSSALGSQLSGQSLGYGGPGSDVAMGSSGWPPMSGSHGYSGNDSIPTSQGDVPGGYRMDTAYAGASNGLGSNYMPSTSSSHWQDSSVGSTSTSTSNASGFSSSSARPSAPAGDWNDSFGLGQTSPGFYTYTTSPQQTGPPAIYDNTLGLPLAGYGEDGLPSPDHLLNTTVRSLTPPLAVAPSSETLVTMPAAAPSERLAAAAATAQALAYAQQPEEQLGLMTNAASAQISLRQETRSAIPVYIDVYWQKVNPQYPFVHRSTVEDGTLPPEHLELLQCSMAAVATQFLEDKNHRIHGNNLHAYAWSSSKLYTGASEWPLPIMQTIAFCEYFARFRGRKRESHRPSALFAKLYQMVINHHHNLTQIFNNQDRTTSWKQWVDAEARRRLLASCFMLDVHGMMYYEQPPIVIFNLDYSSPSTLPIPLLTTTDKLWEAPDATAWSAQAPSSQTFDTVRSIMAKNPTAEEVASAPSFDAAVLMCAYALTLPRRQSLTKPEPHTTKSATAQHLAGIFASSGVANTYLALHYTPLHVLLSVSGESWVFNKKVALSALFSEHTSYLKEWSRSTNALIAVPFAARALRSFLNLTPSTLLDASGFIDYIRGGSWHNICDYWGVYVCTLICWAFGNGQEEKGDEDASRRTGLQWIIEASTMEPEQIAEWKDSRNTLAVICLVRDILSRDCTGGRSILFADSVGVLRKLAGRNDWEWP